MAGIGSTFSSTVAIVSLVAAAALGAGNDARPLAPDPTTLMPGEDNIVLDAIKGDKGDKGDPAPFWRPEWNSTVTTVGDLPPASGPGALGPGDAGRAWYIDGYWHIWTGTGYRVILGAIGGT